MKIIALTMLMSFVSNLTGLSQEQKPPLKTESKKILVAYYSLTNNTKTVATYIQKITGGDLFEIVPVRAYPEKYSDITQQAKREINENYKPPLKEKVKNISQYDIIFIGSPNWWATIAPPVATFLSSYDLKGKILIPFITHEGSREGRSITDIKKLSPESTILPSLAIRGKKVNESEKEVTEWVNKLVTTTSK